MYGLIDCNNFFVSCERVFNPRLENRPVVVLSNNDGCVISRSNEAKALGIKMAVPFFRIRESVAKNNIAVYSANFTLYGDMSDRVMTILSKSVPEMNVYSVDEAFLNLGGIADTDSFCRKITYNVSKCTGIPVSLGVGSTKTLAKMANFYAKRYKKYKQVCIIDTEEKRIKALQKTDIGEIWGIGLQHYKTMEYHSIKTAYDFIQKKQSWVKGKMSVTGERTWLELQGIPCIADENVPDKKQICTSRTFGQPVRDFKTLFESVADFASLCAAKLRKQHSSTKAVMVFTQTNRFDNEYHSLSKLIPLSFYTSDSAEIIHYCKLALENIYANHYEYKRAGVVLLDIIPDEYMQRDLFDPVNREKQRKLSSVIDKITRKNGRESIKLAIQGNGYKPYTIQEHLSKRYTTNLNDIIEIKTD